MWEVRGGRVWCLGTLGWRLVAGESTGCVGMGGVPSFLSPPSKDSGEHGGHSWSDSLYHGTAMVQEAPGRGAGEATKEEVPGEPSCCASPKQPKHMQL